MNNKKYLNILVMLLILSGCNAIKDGLEGNQRAKSAEEFLINKKNPLIIPPDFRKLPKPIDSKNIDTASENKVFDINRVMGEDADCINSESKSCTVISIDSIDDSLEKSIIKIIEKN